jgi:2,3-dihydro-2,3-dihydroxybenzoate dehydrogenase
MSTARRYLVTGAAGGIGAHVVRALAGKGARIAAADLDAAAVRAATGLEGVLAFAGDLAAPGGPTQLVEAAERELGPLDGLVHCAAIGKHVSLLDCSLELWAQIQTVNLTASFELCQAAARRMAERHAGVIVAFASGAGVKPNAGNIPYGASKAGLIGMIRAAAIDLAPYGVRANVLLPGPTETPLMRAIAGDAATLLAARTMLGRLARPEEIAAAAAFLLSDGARYLTGAVLCADGGFLNSGVNFTAAPVAAANQSKVQ